MPMPNVVEHAIDRFHSGVEASLCAAKTGGSVQDRTKTCVFRLAESGGLISNSLFDELADWEDELQRVFEDNPALFEDRPEPCVSDAPSLNGGPS